MKNEIKKALYREKPQATLSKIVDDIYYYEAKLNNRDSVYFAVPTSDMGEKLFDNKIHAQLLIRWLI